MAGRPGRRRRGRTRIPRSLYLFPLPALVLYIIFFAIPTIQALQYSVTNWDGISANFSYIGLNNFQRAITGDSLFTNALGNNLKFMVAVVIGQTVLSLILAVLLVKNTRSNIFLRALYFFPTILSSVSVGFIWKFVYDPNFGLVNSSLGAVGLDGLQSSFMGSPSTAIYWLALAQVWFHTGEMIVIFIAGLNGIPQEYYEAASVDGAGKWRQFRSITWPLIAPAMAIVVAYTTIQSFKAFDLILAISGNPPTRAVDILSTRIYTTFANSELGYAAAEAIIFVLVIGIVTFLLRRFLRLFQGSGE